MSNQEIDIKKTSAKRKKPGRPKKVLINNNIKYEGVCDTGILPNSVMELIYHNPSPLKKIITLFKSMNVKDLTFHFTKDKATILTQDHLEKSILKVDIMGKKMYRYFCEKEFKITLDPENIKKLFGLVNRSCEKILFYSEKNKQHSTLSITIDCLSELGVNSTHNIDLIKVAPFSEDKIPETATYPLYMYLPSKAFKIYINNIHSCSDQFTIQKSNDDEFVIFRYICRNKKTNNIIRFYNNKKGIKINYNPVNKDDLFLASIRCDYCKPISTILLCENIVIRAHEVNRINFEANINKGACIINVYTEIIKSKSSFGI